MKSELLLAATLLAAVAAPVRAQDGDRPGEVPKSGKRAASDAPVPSDRQVSEREAGRPGRSLLRREADVWYLEGKLVGEAQRLLRSPELKKELGEDALVSGDAETRVRTWLRSKRNASYREAARKFYGGCDRPTRELLDRAAQPADLAPEDVLMDWLTYEGLFDLSLVRDGWRRFKAGGLDAAAKELAATFYDKLERLPDASEGIQPAMEADDSLFVSVFGARTSTRTR